MGGRNSVGSSAWNCQFCDYVGVISADKVSDGKDAEYGIRNLKESGLFHFLFLWNVLYFEIEDTVTLYYTEKR